LTDEEAELFLLMPAGSRKLEKAAGMVGQVPESTALRMQGMAKKELLFRWRKRGRRGNRLNQ